MLNVEYKKNEDLEILEATITGEMDFESAVKMSAEARKKAEDLDYLLLKDLTGATLKENILDALKYFDKSKNTSLKNTNKAIVAAIVVEVKNKDFWDFWETVASNNGMISKVFLNKEKAVDWLKTKGKSKHKENSE